MNNQKKAFTLIELVITLTILAILWTISFFALQWYSTQARDSTRISDISRMRTTLEIFNAESWKYPKPTDWVDITYNDTVIWNQGTFWEQVKVNVDKINKVPSDPLSESQYTYSITPNWNKYQLWWILEWDEISLNNHPLILDKTNAWQVQAKAYVIWTYNWIITKAIVESNCTILAVPSIITNDLNFRQLQQIVDNNWFVYRWYRNLPWSFKRSKFNVYGWFWFRPNKLELYTDTIWCSDVLDTTNHSAKISLLKQIQDTYAWTIMQNEWDIWNIVNENINLLKSSNTTLTLAINTVNNTLWWKIALPSVTRNLPNCTTPPPYTWANFIVWNPSIYEQEWQSLDSNAACYWTCWVWKVFYWGQCIVENCTENLPIWVKPNGTSSISNASTMYWWNWNYSTTWWECTFTCNTWYNWNWSTCIINTYIVSGSLWATGAWASVNLWGTVVTADWSWDFSWNINHGTSLSDIVITKTWHTCILGDAWPNYLSWNYTSITWACFINKFNVAWSLWAYAADAKVNLWWTIVTANSIWWFSADIDYWTNLSNINVTKTWATCTISQNWPTSLTENILNISWACNIATYTVSWSFWTNWALSTINACGQTTIADNSWNFTLTSTYLNNCSNITATKVWYVCTTTTQWPSSLSSNISNIAWSCVVHTYTCNIWAKPTNSTTTVWAPTMDNQARQSDNPSVACYFKCSAGYWSTWSSCTATNYCVTWIKEITITWWQTRSCLNLGATEVRDWSTPFACSWTWCYINTPAWLWNYYLWWDNIPTTTFGVWRTTSVYSWSNSPCPTWRHIPSESEMDYTCTKLTWSTTWCWPFSSAIAWVFINRLKFWLLQVTTPTYTTTWWAHWTSQWKPINSAYAISYWLGWVVLTNNYWTNSLCRVRCIK